MMLVRSVLFAAALLAVVVRGNWVLPGELSPSVEDPRLGDEESALQSVPSLDAQSSVDPSFVHPPAVSASIHSITDHVLDKEPSTFHRRPAAVPAMPSSSGDLGPMFMLPNESSGVADGSSESTVCSVERGVRHCTTERHTRHCERRASSSKPVCREWTEHHHTYSSASGARSSSAAVARRAAAAAAARVSTVPSTSRHVECAKRGRACVEHTHTVHRETHCRGRVCTHDIHHEHCTHARGAPKSSTVCTHSVEHVHFTKQKN